MSVTQILAAVPVADHEAAVRWYTTLLRHEPHVRPMDGLAEWHLEGIGVLQVVLDDEHAGGGLVTVVVDDLGAHVRAAEQAGLALPAIDGTTSSSASFVSALDPSGNAVTIVGPVRDAAA